MVAKAGRKWPPKKERLGHQRRKDMVTKAGRKWLTKLEGSGHQSRKDLATNEGRTWLTKKEALGHHDVEGNGHRKLDGLKVLTRPAFPLWATQPEINVSSPTASSRWQKEKYPDSKSSRRRHERTEVGFNYPYEHPRFAPISVYFIHPLCTVVIKRNSSNWTPPLPPK